MFPCGCCVVHVDSPCGCVVYVVPIFLVFVCVVGCDVGYFSGLMRGYFIGLRFVVPIFVLCNDRTF